MSSRDPTSPIAWANLLVRAWGARYPVDVRAIALDYSKRFDDPIIKVAEAAVETFEGALYPLNKTKGWAILYNPTIRVFGRMNFTLAHEFGHYLNHRARVQRFECSQQRVLGYDRDVQMRKLETEADQFASYLLMPLDDFRAQLRGRAMTLDLLNHCADRYGVSRTAAALKWISFTEERAVLVVGRDGFVLWARSSDPAFKSGVYYKSGTPLPAASVAARPGMIERDDAAAGVDLPEGTWRPDEPVREMTVFADRYDLTISLLLLRRETPFRLRAGLGDDDEEVEEDLADRIARGFEARSPQDRDA
jgi:hypothetical protein